MSSSDEIPYQEAETQGLRGDENENSTNDQNNIYEELRVQASAKSDDREKRSSWEDYLDGEQFMLRGSKIMVEDLLLEITVSPGGGRQNSAAPKATNRLGKNFWGKIVFAIVCFIIGIAIASAVIVLFIKVMNNEKTLENFKEMMMNNEITLEEFNKTMINNKEALKESLSRLHSLSANFNKTNDLAAMVPVSSCDQTSINGVQTLISGRKVYCSDGWTVFQRRMDGSIPDFQNKTWDQYREGFGKFTEEFWLGLRNLHEITQRGGCRLRVDLQSWSKDKAYAEYSQFAVADEENLFRLSIGGYNGTAGDSLTNGSFFVRNINGRPFSTIERNNYEWSSSNCAEVFEGGGWWFNSCFVSSLNGLYKNWSYFSFGMSWQNWKGNIPLKFTQMGVRCD